MKNKKQIRIVIIAAMTIIIVMQLIFAQTYSQTATADPKGGQSPYKTDTNPYGASVRIKTIYPTGSRGYCSGTIIKIDKQKEVGYVLTAGHCVQEITQNSRYGSRMLGTYYIDFGPGTRPVQAHYVSHEFSEAQGYSKDIALLVVPIDINDVPYFSEVVDSDYPVKVGDNVYDIGYPGGSPISVVGCQVTGLSEYSFGEGFSIVNFPPRGGRSGGGIFYTGTGQGKVYEKGKLFGVMTNVDPMRGTGLLSNQKQINSFFNRIGFKKESDNLLYI